MLSSTKLGRFFGIDFYLHGTFWLLPLFIFFSDVSVGGLARAVFDVSVVFAAFGCVALHEVGHALAARSYGIRTRDITLYPIGGVARLESMPRSPWQEIVVALAGPAVNLVIAIGLVAGMFAADLAMPVASSTAHLSIEHRFMLRLLEVNLALLLFNLIPAFPMDGGRVLRAVLTVPFGRLRATEIAAGIGSVLAVGLFLVGLGVLDGSHMQPMLMVLAVFLFLIGKGELMAIRYEEAKERIRQRAGNFFGSHGFNGDAGLDESNTFSGWTWDPVRKVWTEWQNGQVIREVASV